MKNFLAPLLIATLLLSACSREEPEISEDQKVTRNENLNEVTVFTVGQDQPELQITKTGTVSAETQIQISPQTSGNVTEIHVEVGETVSKNELLISLGNSTNTDILDIQTNSAATGLNISNRSQELTNQSAGQQVGAANIGAETAYQNYQYALTVKQNTVRTFDEQFEISELELDNAEENLSLSRDLVDDLEDQLDDLRDSELWTQTAENQIKSQLRNAELQEEIAENRVEQSELNLEILEENLQAQIDQLNINIENALSQYQSAINQRGQAEIGGQIQNLQAQSQTNQAQTNYDIARAQQEAKRVRAPQNGVVTSITTEVGSTVSPGQTIIEVENQNNFVVSTTITPEENQFIKNGNQVKVSINGKEYAGQITEISPSADNISKKLNVEISLTENSNITAGVFAKVHFLPQTRSIFIPISTVFFQDSEKFIKTITTNKEVEFTKIETGEIIGDYIEITSGVQAGSKIITSIETFLNEGERIEIK